MPDTELTEAQCDALMEGLRRAGKDHCLLCRKAPFQMAVWFPDAVTNRRLGAPDGTEARIEYCLCRECFERRPDSEREAQAIILREAEALLRSPDSN